MSSQGYVLNRPIEYNLGRFTPGLTESAVNIFHQEVEPTDFNKDRCSFQFKSPGLNTLLSSAIFIEFDLEIKTPSKLYDYASARSANFSMVQKGSGVGVMDGAHDNSLAGATPTICFGEGNALSGAMQSYQLVVNGAALQQVRMDEWKATCDKVFYPSIVMQRRFGRCGGAFNQWDSVAVSGQSFDPRAGTLARAVAGDAGIIANQTRMVSGFTQDSGIAKRIQGVLACTKQAPVVAADEDSRIIRVRAPLEGCGIFNFMGRSDYCSSACPLRSASFCLPHFNVVQINILFKNLFKSVIRNLSAAKILAVGATIDQGGQNGDISVGFPAAGGAQAKLIVDYLRLGSWRNIPSSRTISAYRVAVHDPSSFQEKVPQVLGAALFDAGVGDKNGLAVVGCDRAVNAVSAPMGTGLRYTEANWNGLTMSQIPSYLSFVYQKSTDAYTHAVTTKQAQTFAMAQGVPAASLASTVALQNQAIARNTTASAAPVALDLMIQSSVGSYTYSSQWPYLKTRSELFRDTMKNATLEYCDGCEFKWSRHSGVIFLASQDFARGIGSEGSSMPVVFNAKCRFENRREFVDGSGACSDRAGGSGLLRDSFLFGKPLLLAWFPRMSVIMTPSSGLVTSQNISHASAMQLLGQVNPYDAAE